MRSKNILLTAALSLIMSALLATAANTPKSSQSIPISSVPFAITAPGTYVLTRSLNMAYSNATFYAISIATNIQGPVVLDLGGFTLSSATVAIEIGPGQAQRNMYPITVKNGTVSGEVNNLPGGIPSPATEITMSGLYFSAAGVGGLDVRFAQVSNSEVKNCTFDGVPMQDYGSPGGNRYLNLKFIGGVGLEIDAGAYLPSGALAPTLTLEDCEFAAPAN